MRLHLGCGQNYLNGYVNIDLPPSNHTIQEKNHADLQADLLQLRYPAGTIDEIRLHHVFEHFSRPVALALLASWNSWLINQGILHIEVPDLGDSMINIALPWSSLKKVAVSERHIFGSHEADWAIHKEGYNRRLLKFLINKYGFKIKKIERNSWRGTHNLQILSEKRVNYDKGKIIERTGEILSLFILDDSPSEKKLLNVWMNTFTHQLNVSYAEQ